jgi:hypothetical protein
MKVFEVEKLDPIPWSNRYKHCETGEEISHADFVRECKKRGIKRRKLRYARALSAARSVKVERDEQLRRVCQLLDIAGWGHEAAPWGDVIAWFKGKVEGA